MPDRTYASFDPHRFFAAARAAGHATDTAISRHTGVDSSQLSRIRRGERQPNFNTFWLLVDSYKIDPADVTRRTERAGEADEDRSSGVAA